MRQARSLTRCVLSAVAALALAQWVPAQTAATQGKPEVNIHSVDHGKIYLTAPDFGTVSKTWQFIGAADLDPDGNGTTYTTPWIPPSNMNYQRYVTGGFAHLIGYPRLPGGVLVTGIEYDVCDDNTSGQNLTVNVYDCTFTGVCTSPPLASFTTSDNTGCAGYVGSFPAYTVDNYNHKLLVDVIFGSLDSTNRIAGVSFGYNYQVSPAPGSATFNDVPTSDGAFQFVEALVAAGVTAGCNTSPPLYCPDNPVTRRQMAVFLSKLVGLHWPNM